MKKINNIYIYVIVFLCWLFLNAVVAKINGLHNTRYDITNRGFKIIPWKEVFVEWKYLLSKSIVITLIFASYIVYFLNKKENENE